MEQKKTVKNKARKPAGKNSGSRRSASSLKGRNRKQVSKQIHMKYIAGIALIAVLAAVLIFSVKGCSVAGKTPEKVVKNLVKYYVDGKEKKIKKCYGVKKAEEELQKEIEATIQYFKAHKPQKLKVTDCDTIYQDGKYAYVYITYQLVLENGQSYPCISTYMTSQNEKGKYYVLTPSKITDDMKKTAASKYASFMKTDAYKDYVTAYETFTKKNPGYEEKLATKLSE